MTSGIRKSGGFTTDAALVVQSWDPWLAEATGIPELDACGRAITELFPELERRGLVVALRHVVASGAVEVLAAALHGYLIPCAPPGHARHFTRMQQHATLTPIRDGDRILGVAISIEDVTDRVERERELALCLASEDDAVRLQAVRVLAEEEGSAGPLASALGDPNWRVRQAAAAGLAQGGDHDSIDALLQVLRERHRDPAALNAALTALTHTTQGAVPPLVQLLDAPGSSAELRMYAALALGLLADRRATAALVRALEDSDENVRFHAIEALGRIGDRAAVAPLVAIAASRHFSLAFSALDALAAIGDPSVVPHILPLLHDDLLRDAAAEALGKLGGVEVVPGLAALVNGGTGAVTPAAGALAMVHTRLEQQRRGQLVSTLARQQLTDAAVRRLIDALPRTSDAECTAIVTVLGWLPGDEVDEALASTLSRPGVRRAAAEVLTRRGASAVQALRRALAGDDSETRKASAAALGRIGVREAVPALVPLLEEDSEIAVVVAGALGSIGDRAAFEPLLAQLDHPHAAVRQAVIAALASLGHPETASRVQRLLAAPSPRVREGAAKIAGYFGYRDCVDGLLALAQDPEESVRRTAVEQLAYLDDGRGEAAIAQALASGTPSVRAAAARALAHASAPAARAGLLRASRDGDPWVRYYAARSAGHHGLRDLVPMLVALATSDSVPPVRIAAVEALAEIGGSEGVDALLRRLELDDARPRLQQLARADLDPEVRQAAQRALAE